MVDFPDGYGFAPGGAKLLMQPTFTVEIGRYEWRGTPFKSKYVRTRSPWEFRAIGAVTKSHDIAVARGILWNTDTPAIEGSIQQVVTALCTLHRINGGA